MQNVLVCDDDEAILESLRIYLDNAGFNVITAVDGQDALEKVQNNEIHCVVLDIMMPRLDGLKATLKIREKYNFPIILLSAKSEDTDKITGLGFGADDYVTKPFNILEVKARIKAIIRRSNAGHSHDENPKLLTYDVLKVDCDSRRAYIDEKEVNLTAKEFDLLELLMVHPNKVYSREELLNTVWGYDYPGDVRTVDVHIRRLREKIENKPSDPKYIHTKWGVGYYFQK